MNLDYRSPEFKVGIFALFVIAVISFFTFRVGGLDWLKKKREYIIYAEFRNIGGLDEKSKVKIAGVDAGSIKKIELSDGRARVTIGIYESIKLPVDSIAGIRSTGMLGDRYLEIKYGNERVFLRDGDTIRNIEEMADIDEMLRRLSSVSSNVDRLISSANEVLGSEESKRALKESIQNLRDITSNLNNVINRNDERIGRLIVKLDELATTLRDMVAENKEPLKKTIASFSEFSESLKNKGPGLIENLEKTSSELKAMIEENRENLKKTTDSLSKLTSDIEQGKGTLGKIMKDERLYESLNKAAEGVNKTISKIERFKTFITFQGDYLTRPKDTKGYFHVTLQPVPEKYYILGIVSDPVGRVETKTTITTQNGSTITTTEEEIQKRIEFTALFGRRFNNTGVRFGLMENTFGIGLDQFFMNDKLRLYVDAWDFSKDEYNAKNLHVKAGFDYFVYKSLFLTGGYDNIFNSRWSGFYIGGGVRFEDEDFKYLFGSMPSIPK